MLTRKIAFIAALTFFATQVAAQESKVTRMGPRVGPCVQLAGAHLVNSCNTCRTAKVMWCDGSLVNFDVPAYSSFTVTLCFGTITLVTDVPCDGARGREGRSGGASFGTGDKTRGSMCSAHNEVGDTCSVSCPDGQSANCQNASGANLPSCYCSGR